MFEKPLVFFILIYCDSTHSLVNVFSLFHFLKKLENLENIFHILLSILHLCFLADTACMSPFHFLLCLLMMHRLTLNTLAHKKILQIRAGQYVTKQRSDSVINNLLWVCESEKTI